MTKLTGSVTGRLARLLREKPLVSEDYEAAASFTLDAVANAMAGRNSNQGRILLNWAASRPADAGREALLMGALTHILEVDDLHKASVVHPGCVVVPAAWAVAKAKGASGRAFLKAVIWGFEAACRVGRAVGPAHYEIWHNTATCGPFGAAAAAGSLLGLSDDALVDAFGNAGTQSAGLWQFLETGAMTKHLHAGRGAEAGVVAAELAAGGFTGPPEILEGPRGFFRAMCPDGDPAAVVASPERAWDIHATSIKPWPSCRHTHPIIDAARQLKLLKPVLVDQISSIEISTYRAALAMCDRPSPDTDYAAKFSLQHTVGAALAHDNVTLDSFGDAARRDLADLRAKVMLRNMDDLEAAYPARWGGAVQLTFAADGESRELRVSDALGDPEHPLSLDDLKVKAKGLLQHGGVADPAALIEGILQLADDGPLPTLML